MTASGGRDDATKPHAESRERVLDSSAALAALRRLGDRIGGAVRTSFLYRWLTKEPEPDVIVIDLRETYTIGPIIALLDRVIDWLAPAWRASMPKRALDRVGAVAERAAETRAGQLLAKLLAPPEPPASERDSHADDPDATSSGPTETRDGDETADN